MIIEDIATIIIIIAKDLEAKEEVTITEGAVGITITTIIITIVITKDRAVTKASIVTVTREDITTGDQDEAIKVYRMNQGLTCVLNEIYLTLICILRKELA